MFKSALIYRTTHWDAPAVSAIEDRLSAARFAECTPTQPEASGWVEPRGARHAALIENIGGQLILRLCVERNAVPGSVVKLALNQRLDKIELDTGRRPKGKQAKEMKEEIVHDLLPRAFPKRSDTLVWIDPQARLLWVNAASLKKADGIVTQAWPLLPANSANCFRTCWRRWPRVDSRCVDATRPRGAGGICGSGLTLRRRASSCVAVR